MAPVAGSDVGEGPGSKRSVGEESSMRFVEADAEPTLMSLSILIS